MFSYNKKHGLMWWACIGSWLWLVLIYVWLFKMIVLGIAYLFGARTKPQINLTVSPVQTRTGCVSPATPTKTTKYVAAPEGTPNLMNEDETRFYSILCSALSDAGVQGHVDISLMSNNTICYSVNGIGMGRAKLRGKTKIQIIESRPGHNVAVTWRENLTAEQMIDCIPYWVQFVLDESAA